MSFKRRSGRPFVRISEAHAERALCSFMKTGLVQGEQSRALRAIPAGQKMNIWLELEAAEAYGNVNTDVFQVSCSPFAILWHYSLRPYAPSFASFCPGLRNQTAYLNARQKCIREVGLTQTSIDFLKQQVHC